MKHSRDTTGFIKTASIFWKKRQKATEDFATSSNYLQKLSKLENLRKILLLNTSLSLSKWIETLSSKGRHSFSLEEVRSSFPENSEAAIKLKLNRLSNKGKVISVHKGYYLIITPQYEYFIGDIMGLVRPAEQYNQIKAYELVTAELIDRM